MKEGVGFSFVLLLVLAMAAIFLLTNEVKITGHFINDGNGNYTCYNCSDCTAAIAAAGVGDVVYLNNSIYNSTDNSCIDFNGKDSITFDCQGYTIDGDNSTAYSGIDLGPSNTNSNIIQNCSVQQFTTGVYIRQSSNNIIRNIEASENDIGVYLTYLVSNTTIENVSSFSNYEGGIKISQSNPNTLKNNNFSGNGNHDFNADLDATYTNQTITTTNIVDYDKVIYYNYSASDYIFDETTAPNAGVVYCTNCDNVTYKNLHIESNNFYDMVLLSITNSSFENITIVGKEQSTSSSNGIFARDCNYNNFTGFNITNNGYGIYFYNSGNTIVSNSTFNYNAFGINDAGGLHYNSTFVNIDTSYNSYSGISTSNNIITLMDNITSNYNGEYGIQLSGSQINITNSNMSGNKYDFSNPAGSSNTVDFTNTVDFYKKIYYNTSTQNFTFTPANSPNASMFFCTSCDNVTYSDFNLGDVYSAFQIVGGSNIHFNNITLDDMYYAINFYGGSIDNVTILNSRIYNSTVGINVYAASDNYTIRNITIDNASNAIQLDGSNHLVTDVNVTNSRGYGIYFTATNSVVNNSRFIRGVKGISIGTATGTKIYNNIFNNTENFYSGGTDASFNTVKTAGTNIIGGSFIGGNYWAYPNGTTLSDGCIDDNSNGICDYSVKLDSNTYDYFPLTTSGTSDLGCDSCSSCNSKIEKAIGGEAVVKMNSSILDVVGSCIKFYDGSLNGISNVTFDCQGYIIDGDSIFPNYEDGISLTYSDADYNTIQNCVVKDFENGVRFRYADYNNIVNVTSRNNQESNFFLEYADHNVFNNVTSIEANIPSNTYHISQLMDGNFWQYIYSKHFPADYVTEEFLLDKEDGRVKIRITQEDIAFADVEQIKLVACGEELSPEYAIRLENGQSILDDILDDDYNTMVMGGDTIEISWNIQENCSISTTLYLKANEYGNGMPFREPDSYNDFITYKEKDSGPINLDGVINESDGIKSPDFNFFWTPASGHPEGYVYTYIDDDDGYLYFSFDITVDNSNEFGEDWMSVIFNTSTGKKEFKIDDFNDTYGKCAFGLTSKVSYNHQTCEFKIPKSEVASDNYNFAVEYYGTAAPITYQTGNGFYFVEDSEYNTIKNSNIQDNPNCGFYFQDHYGYPRYNNFYNNIINNTNNTYFSTSLNQYFNTTNTTTTNIVNGSYIGGNFWATPTGTGFSETCTDADADGFCDSSYTVGASNIDYLPLVNLLVCTESWSCTTWSTCTGTQTRTCTDANACGTTLTKPVESQSCTVDDGGSSSSGGGGTTTTTTEDDGVTEVLNGTAQTVFDTIIPNETSTIVINDSDGGFGLTDVSFDVDGEISGASISIAEVDSRDDATLQLGVGDNFATFVAFDVDKNGITNDNITTATLNFKVEKQWAQDVFGGMAGFAKNYVAMYKRETVDDSWQQVDTEFLSEDTTYYYYRATSDGFSRFMIGLDTSILNCEVGEQRCIKGSIRKCVENGNETTWDLLKVCDNGCKDADSCEGFKFDKIYLVFGGLVLLLVGLVVVIIKFLMNRIKIKGNTEKKVVGAQKAVSKYVDKGKNKRIKKK